MMPGKGLALGLLAGSALVLFATVGCEHDRRIEIGGLVTLDGVPLQRGVVEFAPADGRGPTAGALISDGRYTIRVAPGIMKVRIQGYKVVGEERAVAEDPESPVVPKVEPILPARYNAETTLTFEVVRSTTSADFALRN
jgi:hypothetical protein